MWPGCLIHRRGQSGWSGDTQDVNETMMALDQARFAFVFAVHRHIAGLWTRNSRKEGRRDKTHEQHHIQRKPYASLVAARHPRQERAWSAHDDALHPSWRTPGGKNGIEKAYLPSAS